MVVHENFNAGWQATSEGEALTPIRVDGWQQGFVLPAGDVSTVTLTFEPDSTYRWAFVIGAFGLLVVVAAAAVGRRGGKLVGTLGASTPHRVIIAGVLALALGLLAGWWGLLVAVVAIATGVSRLADWPGWPLLAGAGVAAAGVATAYERSQDQIFGALTPQLLVLVALGCVGVAALRRGNRMVRSRDIGRSTR